MNQESLEGLARLIGDTSMRAGSEGERRQKILDALEHAHSEGMFSDQKIPSTIDGRFDAAARDLCPNPHKLRALYWEMKAELAEDLGFYLGRLKEIERENERLRAQLDERNVSTRKSEEP